MLRLNLPKASRWHDLPHGVRFLCKPMTTALDMTAEARAQEEVEAAREAAKNAGKPDPYADRARLAGALFEAKLVHLALDIVEQWEGVGNHDGSAPEPLGEHAMRALMTVKSVAHAFNAAVARPILELVAEGNGFAPSPNTISAPGASIATDASTSSDDPALTALMRETRPGLSTASLHGSPGAPVSP